MEILIWIGSILSLLGLVGLLWCIKTVLRAKKAGSTVFICHRPNARYSWNNALKSYFKLNLIYIPFFIYVFHIGGRYEANSNIVF